MGGAVRIGEATDPQRGWYFPPDVVTKNTRKNKLKLKSKPIVASVAAATAIDTWAFGILIYELLSGASLPLYKRSDDRNANAVGVKAWNEKALRRALIGLRVENEAAANLLAGLLHPKPTSRISSMDAVLSHELFAGRKEETCAPAPLLPPPENTPEVDTNYSEDSTELRNPKDVVYRPYPLKEPKQSTAGKSYPTQQRRATSMPKESSCPVLERRIYPIQERTIYPVQERGAISSEEDLSQDDLSEDELSSEDDLYDQEPESSSSYEQQQKKCSAEVDCLSSASSQFRVNATAEVVRSGHDVPIKVAAAETKPRRGSGSTTTEELNGQRDVQTRQRIASFDASPEEDYDLISARNSVDSDDGSEPGRIIMGSRRKTATVTSGASVDDDLQMI